MAILRTITKVRPNTSVSFKLIGTNDHIKAKYVNTEKQIHYTKRLSEDGLTLTVERMFIDRDALTEFERDDKTLSEAVGQRAYNKENGIKVTKEITTLE